MDEIHIIHIALPTRPRDPERHSRWKKRYQFGLQPLLNTVSSSSSAKGASVSSLRRCFFAALRAVTAKVLVAAMGAQTALVAPVAAVGAQTAPVAAAVAAVLTWLVVSLSGLEQVTKLLTTESTLSP